MCTALILVLSLSASNGDKDIFTKITHGYKNLGDAQMHFQQSYTDALRGTKRSEQGEIYLSNNGKVRWVYRSPVRKDFIFNGTHAYFYEPDFAQVTLFENFAGSPLAQTLGALWGQGQLEKHFTLTKITPATAEKNVIILELSPKEALSGVQSVELHIDAENFLVKQSKLLDPLGNATVYEFKNFKKVKSLKNDIFDFTIPEGVNVLRAQSQPESATEKP
jgi:outer membrane lipoprotein carrier protein